MSLLGLIAFVSGTAGVLLTIRQSILCWPAAILSTIAAGVEFFQARLFGDMSLQVFYFVAGVYGWVYWQHQRDRQFEVNRMPRSWWLPLAALTVFQAAAYYFMLKYFNGARPLFDALLTACSLTTTYMMTRKWLENWMLWVLIDAIYIVLYFQMAMWLYALLYAVFSAAAFYGWIRWRKIAS